MKLEKFVADLMNLRKEVSVLREATKSDVEVAKKLQGIPIVPTNKSYLESEQDESKKSSLVVNALNSALSNTNSTPGSTEKQPTSMGKQPDQANDQQRLATATPADQSSSATQHLKQESQLSTDAKFTREAMQRLLEEQEQARKEAEA